MSDHLEKRQAPINIDPEKFKQAGHYLVDKIAELLESLPDRSLTQGESPSEIKRILGQGLVPQQGEDVNKLIETTTELLLNHSLFNGHPKFLGYITSSPAPIGMLAELLASAVNPNVGAWLLSPVATEIELQTVGWISEMIGYNSNCGGVLVSGGNMANFVGFLTGLHEKAGLLIREEGMQPAPQRGLCIYASAETHTWIQKAAAFFGIGTNSICWIPTDDNMQMDISLLRQQIEKDKAENLKPIMVIGTAGSVSTGVVDRLDTLANFCQENSLWFHVDGAYGAFAAMLDEQKEVFKGMSNADSIALDPHKWLYAPLEAGCALVRDRKKLAKTFSFHPEYYKFAEVKGEPTISMVDFGLQNSRGFRALKVWLAIKQVGLNGYKKMIAGDIELAKYMFDLIDNHEDFEAKNQNLSITTFRYLPSNLKSDADKKTDLLNSLNRELLTTLQEGGEAFVSNAVIDGNYYLRACIVNFRTTKKDIRELVRIIEDIGSFTRQKI